ncbi:hypothetical protein CEXT_784291 [Caerostris extrusa]|uniref:Uncharacterized protein n=1 Tax=Caerostris extrusa TaxID=172846 RepID=A0AAV4MLK1_CAEEX|nr:hypothetical protein CEXT_784291 [Caerostris extrusa]
MPSPFGMIGRARSRGVPVRIKMAELNKRSTQKKKKKMVATVRKARHPVAVRQLTYAYILQRLQKAWDAAESASNLSKD